MPSELETAIRRTRRQIDDIESPVRQQMADLYSRTIRNLDTDIMLITQRIEQARLGGETVNPDWLRRETRYRRLLDDAEREFARFADDGLRVIENGQVQAVRGGAAQAWELMDASGIETAFGGRVNTIAVENALSATTSAPLRRSLARYGAEGSQTITDTLLDGIARGRGPRAIARDIQRGLNSPYNRARLESLVRTEMMRASNYALDEQYKQMDHLISGYRWSAAKSVRTCLACLSLDGRIFKTYQHTQHPRCRCICTPVPRGSTYQYQTGADWFAKQPAAIQQRMMPSRAAWEAYRDGGVRLQDFVGTHRDRVWGTSVYQRSGRQVLRNVERRVPITRRSRDSGREFTIREDEDSIRLQRFETAVLYDDAGRVLFRKDGGKTEVSFSDAEIGLMRDRRMTHNHPRGWDESSDSPMHVGSSFSKSDIVMFIKAELREMRAVSVGHRYSLARKADGSLPANKLANLTWDTIEKRVAKIEREVQAIISRRVTFRVTKDGQVTVAQANSIHSHIVSTRAAQVYDLEYTREAIPGVTWAESDYLERIIAEILKELEPLP